MADELTNQAQNQEPTGEAQTSGPQAADSGGAPEGDFGGGRGGRGGHGGHGGHGGRGGHGGGRGGPGGPGGRGGRGERGGRDRRDGGEVDDGGIEEAVVKVYRCATVVKGGRRFSFAALVVCGDRQGKLGVGYGKANEVPSAVDKASKAARRNMVPVKLDGTTIPHRIRSKYRASEVVMLPASKGTGIIAGAAVRSVLELAGVKDVLTKVYGSTNPKNLVKATFEGLLALRVKADVARLREVTLA